MSHNIDFSKNKAAAWSNKLVSWHNLGEVTHDLKTSKEILELSGLDFEVLKEPIYLANGKIIKDSYATVRQDTNEALGVVGSKYVVSKNSDAFAFFDDVIGVENVSYETAGALKNGKMVYVTAKLNEGMLINNADPHNLYINFYNIHDGTKSLKIFTSTVRIVCNNTLSAAISDNKSKKRGLVSIRHTNNQNIKLSQAKDILKISKEEFEEKKEFLEKLSTINLSTQITKELALQCICDYVELDRIANKEEISNVLSTRKLNIVNNLVWSINNGVGQKDLPDTAYKWIQGITNYTSNMKGKQEDRQFDMFFGSSLDLQNKAVQLAQNLI